MIILTLISLVLAVSFTGIAMIRLKSIPESVSSLVYVFKNRWLWTVWLWTTSLLTFIPVIGILSRSGMGFLGFGVMACLMFCGAVPLFDKDNEDMHWITGTAGCILSQICVWFIEAQWLGVWMPCLFLIGAGYVQPEGWLGRATKGKAVFLAESACYLSQTGSMLLRYFSDTGLTGLTDLF